MEPKQDFWNKENTRETIIDICKNKKSKTSALNFNFLKFKKCIFMTDEQFNKSKIHKPKNTLFVEKLIKAESTKDIDDTINEIITEIHKKLIEIYTDTTIKIPHPIFVMLGRELELNNNLFDVEVFEHEPKIIQPDPSKLPPNTPIEQLKIKYGNTDININNNKIVILDYIKGFFTSGLSTKEDEYKYNSSIINSYQFKGNIRIYLYVPYLKSDYKFITNLNDLTNSFYFFNTILKSDYYMNISRTSTFDADKFRKDMKKLDKNMVELMILLRTYNDNSKYHLYDDLLNLCFEGGCVTDIGDDFNSLIPSFTDDEDTNNKNATDKSPFMPTKCLSKTNGFLCNVRFLNKNKDIHEFIKKDAIKEIQENLKSYTRISNKIQNSEKLQESESEYFSRFTSPVNLIVSVINNFIKKYYSYNLNDNEKDKITYNHYSKMYSENMIKELSYLKKMNGIPEFVMSLYMLKEETMVDKIGYMPFKDIYPTSENIFNFGDIIMVDEILYSSNKKYGMKLINNGFVSIFNTDTNKVMYFLNREFIKNPTEMTIQENGLLISFINEQGNLIKRNYLYKISSLVDDCKLCKPPFSLIIKDDGYLSIYGNGYYDATSKEFKNYIDSEIKFSNNMNMNMNDITSIKNSLNENSLNVNDKYIYCSPNSIGCKK